jgi:hypothetical protein
MAQSYKLVFLSLVVAGGMLAAGVFLLKGSPKHRPREYRLTAAEPAAELPSPKPRAAPVSPERIAPQPQPKAAAAPVPPVEAENSEDSPGTEPAPLEPADQVAFVESVHTDEPVDRSWAADAAHKLDAGLQRYIKAGARLMSVDCRTSLCKVRVSHRDENDQTTFVENAFMSSDYWPGARMAWRQEQADGSVTSELFFAKDGAPMPQIN